MNTNYLLCSLDQMDYVNETLPDILEQLKEKMINQEKNRFNFLTDINEKVNFVEKLLKKHQLLPNIRQSTEKSEEMFNRCSVMTTEALINKENPFKILASLNKCIAFAQNDTEHLIKTYVRRSEVFYDVDLYIECLSDINLILESKHCPSKDKERLERRKRICEHIIEKYKKASAAYQDDVNQITQLTYPKHSNIPFIANCLKLNKFSNSGRSIQTTCDLKIGDIIAIEKPFVSTLNKSLVYEHCTNCLKETFSLIPCPACTLAMFCNRKCLEIAYEKFHKYECTVIDYIFETFTDLRLISVRMALQTISLFKHIDRLERFLNDHKSTDTNIFNINYSYETDYEDDNDDSDTDDNHDSDTDYINYYPVHGLANGISKSMITFNTDQYLHLSILTVLVKQLLIEILPADVQLTSAKKFINSFLFRQFEIATIYDNITTNFTSVASNNAHDYYTDIFGRALYPFGGLINHSCAPNIMRIYNGSTVSIVVLRPIRKNEQLFVNYGASIGTSGRKERQDYLKTRYNFECRCEACINNYTVKEDPELPRRFKLLPRVNDLNGIIKNIKINLEFLNTYSNKKHYPCKQINIIQDELRKCLSYGVQYDLIELYKKS